jgi:hypothetical protein
VTPWAAAVSDTGFLAGVGDLGPASNPLAAAAGLAVVLGNYWAAPLAAVQPARPRRFPRLPGG